VSVYKLRAFRDELWSARITYEVEADSLKEAIAEITDDPETYQVAAEEFESIELIRAIPDDKEDFEVLEGE
jgi:hypothetical protein